MAGRHLTDIHLRLPLITLRKGLGCPVFNAGVFGSTVFSVKLDCPCRAAVARNANETLMPLRRLRMKCSKPTRAMVQCDEP